MSLKAFHIVFIALCVVLAFGFGAWELKGYLVSGYVEGLIVGVLSLAVGVALILYGIRFLKKLKHVGLM